MIRLDHFFNFNQNMRKFIIAFFLVAVSASASGQNGFLRGKVTEQSTGEGLFGATVIKTGTTQGVVTDFDGNFSLSLPAGTHSISIQSVSFKPIQMDGVEIVEGEVTIMDFSMSEDVQTLEAVVVEASVIKDSDAGMMLIQRKSLNTLDGISSSAFRRTGDNNLSTAMARVTGVTVQDGKYVFVRGLGDRYSKTSLNGMLVPGLDPDRNDVQIDIFPTGILENVVVYKTFTPDLVGTFAGGLVDIQSKDFPEEKTTNVRVGFGFNPSMHFNSNYLSYEGSSTDALGFDNGQRALPAPKGAEITPSRTPDFNPVLGGSRSTSGMNYNMSVTHRNQLQREKLTWGYNLLLNYRNTTNFFEDYEIRRYERDRTTATPTLVRDYTAIGDLGSNEVLWSGLASLAAKTANSTIGVQVLHIQNGTSTALKREQQVTSLNNPTFIHNDILTYTERAMTNTMLFGKHQLGKFRVEWANSLVFSNLDEPDYRETGINRESGEYLFTNGGKINRFWRELNEFNESAKVDVTYELTDNHTLKAGSMFTYRDREFGVSQYTVRNPLAESIDSSDPNDILFYSTTNTDGNFYENFSDESNSFDGSQTVTAFYAMHEAKFSEKVKAIYGARLEMVNMLYTGEVRNQDGTTETLNDVETLNESNLLPSMSFIYSPSDEMNIRASFNKTLARPSFKEKSSAFIADPITGLNFNGNIDLKQAEILNYDLRWEYFFNRSEMMSLSTFYKDFTNHIAVVAFSNRSTEVKPRNVGSASLFGAEFEFRKSLAFATSYLEDVTFGTNLSYVISRVDRTTVPVNEDGLSEYDADVANQGSSDGIKKFRDLSGQAPFAINAFLNYDNTDLGLSANLAYNVQGETLSIVGASFVPAVYTRSFHSLNLKVSKELNEKSNVSLTVRNLLDDENERFYELNGEEQIFELRRPGRSFSVSYSFNF